MFLRYLVPAALAALLVQAHPIDENHSYQEIKRVPLAINKVDQRMHPSAPRPPHSLLTPSLGSVRKQFSLAKQSLQDRSGHLPIDGNMVDAGMQKVEMGLDAGIRVVNNDRSQKATREEFEARGLRPKSNKPTERVPGDSLPVNANPEQEGIQIEMAKIGSKRRQEHKMKRHFKTPDYKGTKKPGSNSPGHESLADRPHGDDVRIQ